MIETSFGQDLNDDGVTGLNIPTTVIESTGATDLTQVGSNYYLYAHGTTTGPTVKFLGIDYVAGQFGAWTPLGAEAAGGGYQVAWKDNATGHYTVWQTDSSGNYLSNVVPVVTGADPALQMIETSFGQDLNDDGAIGSPNIAEGMTLEIIAPYTGDVIFVGSTGTLKLDKSSDFSGTVLGLADQDTFDFADIDFATSHQPTYSGTSAGGTLTVADDTHTANIALLGDYLDSVFVTSDDGDGGTTIVDPGLDHELMPLTQPQYVSDFVV